MARQASIQFPRAFDVVWAGSVGSDVDVRALDPSKQNRSGYVIGVGSGGILVVHRESDDAAVTFPAALILAMGNRIPGAVTKIVASGSTAYMLMLGWIEADTAQIK